MRDTQPMPPRFDLTRNETGTLTVDMEAFFEFSFNLAEDLEDLIARYRVENLQPRRRSETHAKGSTK